MRLRSHQSTNGMIDRWMSWEKWMEIIYTVHDRYKQHKHNITIVAYCIIMLTLIPMHFDYNEQCCYIIKNMKEFSFWYAPTNVNHKFKDSKCLWSPSVEEAHFVLKKKKNTLVTFVIQRGLNTFFFFVSFQNVSELVNICRCRHLLFCLSVDSIYRLAEKNAFSGSHKLL